MSSFYTESLFALLSFTGMHYAVRQRYIAAALVWGVTSATRSNAIIYCGYFFYDLVLARLQQPIWVLSDFNTMVTVNSASTIHGPGAINGYLFSTALFKKNTGKKKKKK
ncbi:hypothetical protein DFQ28_003635 [Apophysomyces sp. BC1034]|nr:hypothetical protein DFQ30_001841 [Apophysomyces sp. BC1015]KAG0182906.1 hypothetical protein DFQ29_001344 [Apophysomyces sp. BC1021]KAG0193715.1 hypothetical protein DFQ28_003635 [Apophysomyces sp. BC1034]